MIHHSTVLYADQSFVQPSDDEELNGLGSLMDQPDGSEEPSHDTKSEIANCSPAVTSESSDATPVTPPRMPPNRVSRARHLVPPALMAHFVSTCWGRGDLQFAVSCGVAPIVLPGCRGRKHNKTPKGQGPDSAPDPAGRDRYEYHTGHFYKIFEARIKKRHADALRFICNAISKHHSQGLTRMNRWVTRRVPCGYAWLDENRQCISDELLSICFSELAASGLF
jgi:hypothetical protein